MKIYEEDVWLLAWKLIVVIREEIYIVSGKEIDGYHWGGGDYTIVERE